MPTFCVCIGAALCTQDNATDLHRMQHRPVNAAAFGYVIMFV
jgi:hypothetical protein